MHKTEGANHSSNRFTDGPPGTTVEEDWMNAVQDELRNAIEDAGLVLKTAGTETGNQLSAAIQLLATQGSITGGIVRSKFRWKDANEIYIGAGTYHHEGTTEQFVYWDSELTFQFLNLGASDWSYLYIDDSAIITLGSNLLTAAEFVDSITPPTFDPVKKGWYNGSDRCIFAVFTSGASAILEFNHEGDVVLFADEIADHPSSDIDNVWTDLTALTIPAFTNLALVTIETDTSATGWWWRTNDQTATVGHKVIAGVNGEQVQNHMVLVITDEAQIIEMQASVSDGSKIALDTEGWKFGIGI